MDPVATGLVASVVLAALIFISSTDDFIVDVWTALIVPPLPTSLRKDSASRRRSLREQQNESDHAVGDDDRPFIGVLIANWHEAEVLPRMVAGNLAAIHYPNFRLFLGVYPNDLETVAAARACAQAFPDRVTVIVNSLPGPTSKGQMLNEMFNQLWTEQREAPDLVLLQDSEDIIDPGAFDLYARHSRTHAFVQIPVFSLDSKARSLTGATYMDEFADRHLREMRLRSQLGVVVPSAGVGTMLRRDLIEHFLDERGEVLRSGTVTEDYILGWEAHAAGFPCSFVAELDPHDGHIIATREYFPKELKASVRQKSRWIFGIGFEGIRQLGWRAKPLDLFFLYRDRKGLITNFVPALALVVLALFALDVVQLRQLDQNWGMALGVLLFANLCFTAIRYVHRMRAHAQVYGRLDPLQVALRWLLAIIINAWATLRAWRSFLLESRFATRPITWVKTAHEVPEAFTIAPTLGRPQLALARGPIEVGSSARNPVEPSRALPETPQAVSTPAKLSSRRKVVSPRPPKGRAGSRRQTRTGIAAFFAGLLNAAGAGLLIATIAWMT